MTIDEMQWPHEIAAMQIGDAKGHARGLTEAILDAVEARFGAVSEDVRAKIQQLTEESRLRRAHRLAVTEPTLDQFLANM